MRQRKTDNQEDSSSSASSTATKHIEIDRFVNPLGALVLLFALPILVNFLNYSCHNHKCNEYAAAQHILSASSVKEAFYTLFPIPKLFDFGVVLGWYLIQLALFWVIPGYYFLGYECYDGTRLYYKINGLACYLLTLGSFVGGAYSGYITERHVDLIFNNLLTILTADQIIIFGVSAVLYLKGYLFKQGNPSGSFLVDFFYGYEANPRFFGLADTDLKWFTEGRALILWVLMGFFYAYKQYLTLGHVSLAMIVCCTLHFFYILHYYVYETNVLNMLDFTSDHQGFMLQWGNGVFVPFMYSMPQLFNLKNPNHLPVHYAIGIVALYATGYFIFRQANLQKKQFREDPTKPIWGQPPKVLRTSRGRSLLVSGWWGIARKMNYTGDLIQAFCFGLPCLALSPTPFLNFIFLTTVLIQRDWRDNAFCRAKYGSDWDEYCKVVPYRMIPYVY